MAVDETSSCSVDFWKYGISRSFKHAMASRITWHYFKIAEIADIHSSGLDTSKIHDDTFAAPSVEFLSTHTTQNLLH